MQEEVENRSVTLAINTAKLTARTLKSAILKFLAAQKTRAVTVPTLSHMASNRSNSLQSKIKE